MATRASPHKSPFYAARATRACLLLCVLLPASALGLSTDRDQPIEVEADRLEVRDDENISIYEGNVSLVQGSLRIRSDRLVIHFNDQRELTLMEMTGSPARLRQLDDQQREMRGQALRINYTESESLLELVGDARFDHAGDTIESEQIRINTDNNSIQAGGSDPDRRVKMLIQPDRE